MAWLRALTVLAFSGSVACASSEAAFVRSPSQEGPARSDAIAHSTLGAAIAIPALAPQTPLAEAIALYEAGEPPPSRSPVLGELYQRVCAERSRARRLAYDAGDETARRQDCYCADSMPCSVNRDCSDLVVCHSQIVLADVRSESPES